MKVAIAFLVATAAVAEVSPAHVAFDRWSRAVGRNFTTARERETRLNNFRVNLEEIASLNELHKDQPGGAQFRANRFADMSKAEFSRYLGFRANRAMLSSTRVSADSTVKVADSRDYRTHPFPVLAPIQDQAQCGSCWAFSSITNVESTLALAYNRTVQKLSEQQLVDCDRVCGNYTNADGCDEGCNGGLMPNAWTYLKDAPLMSEDEYPYTGSDGKCKATGTSSGVVTGFDILSTDEEEIKAWIDQKGPVAVAVDASQWSFYAGGIMTYLCWGKASADDLNHAVNIVGYGSENGQNYWIVRNSWGTWWGESGYARVIRGTGFCGINLFACNVAVRKP